MAAPTDPRQPRTPRAAALLGFALGGFFDGILLHQVLQWHHLLSNVGAVRDLRRQLLADGLFHALMYVLALVALVLLWRRRAQLGSASGVVAAALAGFGLWHVADTLLSHWITRIHRVRVGMPDPLFWDLLWFGVFGVVPLLAAWWLRRRPSSGDGTRAASALAVAAVTAGAWSLPPRPMPGGEAVVLFAPGVAPAQAFAALGRLDARVRWVDAGGGVWSVAWSRPPSAMQLLREGALLAGGTALGLGCVASSRAAE